MASLLWERLPPVPQALSEVPVGASEEPLQGMPSQAGQASSAESFLYWSIVGHCGAAYFLRTTANRFW